MSLEINGKLIETDNDGFLRDPYQWLPAITEAMADVDGVTLTDSHWAIIRLLRDHYDVYEIAPDLRALSKAIERSQGPGKGSKARLAALFPQSPAITASRYAGLPKPVRSGCP